MASEWNAYLWTSVMRKKKYNPDLFELLLFWIFLFVLLIAKANPNYIQ